MGQSPLHADRSNGIHVAMIMDGNGRWAEARGLPRSAGHRAGAEAVRRVVEAAPRLGIGTLTLFAFSSDNWQRPPRETARLLQLVRAFLLEASRECPARGVRLTVIGRRDRLPAALRTAIEAAEHATAWGRAFHLRLAVDYSARDAILRAAARLAGTRAASREAFARVLAEVDHDDPPAPDVDLLVRTGGERRLSDFLLWESAYAELVFSDRMWPDVDASDLEAALRDFLRRDRRFGAISPAAMA
jgi:undecaprenyl diphosphate synthase